MKINLTPQRRDDTLEAYKYGSTVIVNGESFDFSAMLEGSTLPRSAISSIWLEGDVELNDGELEITLLIPLPQNYSQEQAFPVPLLNVPNGLIQLPQPLPISTMRLTEEATKDQEQANE
ncbi:hypothetical protein [Pseudomonas syringae]|uniref:hypothetical protein n=1 Tax=Pseudomonas syringae TaxID=317 RepID=UPI00020972C1|nr:MULTISPECIES: hypothetical protein [Pseudomonas syringae group]EGH99585.1 hypothetical protein PLA106_26120 [Pseudomonas amygdali pv. lachrymans str. M302278]KPC07570.1 Uncharacterized protein AC500_0918 [Pseudomonas amygdali pv. lachrymans]RMM09506.1 hypothetical protein ALQ85_102120 [Pseudomonas syringae]